MSTAREQAIEAVVGCGYRPRAAAAVVDAVEPIFSAEADRRVDRTILRGDRIYRGMIAQAIRDERARLRAQVEALRDGWIATREPWRSERVHGLNEVLALLDAPTSPPADRHPDPLSPGVGSAGRSAGATEVTP